MRAQGWRVRTIRALIRLDRDLNEQTAWIPMPGGHALGSGKRETYCAYWHRLDVWWANGFCRLIDFIDCDHCKKSAEEYEGKGQWLMGK